MLISRSLLLVTCLLAAPLAARAATSDSLAVSSIRSSHTDTITVSSYYFPDYHPGDSRNTAHKGKDWSEWNLVRAARPRFPGHRQPKIPLWGYGDEADPQVMAKKIDAAADHGIGAFIFDWYAYNDGPFLEDCLDRGYLKAPNHNRVKFALMWANHDWVELHPYTRGTSQPLLYPGRVTPENFVRITNRVIHDYFLDPSYWRVDGKPYFSFYDLEKLMSNFGSIAATRQALDDFRRRAVAAGLPGIHLNAVVFGQPVLPGEKKVLKIEDTVDKLGFDSVTSYVWVHHVGLVHPQNDYKDIRDGYFAFWAKAEKQFRVPYFPNITMGWDPSPRTNQKDKWGNWGYPFTNVIVNNTPEQFRTALEMAKKRLLSQKDGPRILNINCWNEWTEGSYLEPDTVTGMKYLDAVKDVFGKK